MARPPRMQIAGGAYHVTARGVARQALFRDDADRRRFLQLTADAVRRHGWACHGFCLMTTHYHLLLRTPRGDLARGMQRLNSCYAQDFNRRHGETGHRLERRYHSVLITGDLMRSSLCGTWRSIRYEPAPVEGPRTGHGAATPRASVKPQRLDSSPSNGCSRTLEAIEIVRLARCARSWRTRLSLRSL